MSEKSVEIVRKYTKWKEDPGIDDYIKEMIKELHEEFQHQWEEAFTAEFNRYIYSDSKVTLDGL